MRVVIDRATCRFVLRRGPDTIEGEVGTCRTYTKLSLEELHRLYRNTTGLPLTVCDYNAAVQVIRALALRKAR